MTTYVFGFMSRCAGSSLNITYLRRACGDVDVGQTEFWQPLISNQATAKFEPSKAHYSTPIYFGWSFLIRAY